VTTPIYAGVDGGGTKTIVVLVDGDGAEIARAQAGTSNPAVIGHEESGKVLQGAIRDAVSHLQSDATLAAAWFGLAGCDRPDDQRALGPYIVPLATSVRLTNDGELVLGALPGAAGVALVAGTGSIAFGRTTTGERCRAGGWGAIMGDEGSGYALGCGLLRAFAADIDQRGPVTSMTSTLIDEWGLSDPFEAISRVYGPPMSKGEIAGLARIVVDAAAAGDAVAGQLLHQAATDLALIAGTVGKRLGFSGSLPIALTGSLLVHVDPLRTMVIRQLERDWASLDVRIVADPALVAARFVAGITSA
jgi:glucosamine kinase